MDRAAAGPADGRVSERRMTLVAGLGKAPMAGSRGGLPGAEIVPGTA